MEKARTEYVRHGSDLGTWELVRRPPDRRLRGIVRRYEGFEESASSRVVLRQEVPSVHVPLILNFGARWRLELADGAADLRDSFVAGLHESSTFVAAEGRAMCVQVDFTPIGAYLVFGLPMHELANRVVDAEYVLGRERDLVARLEAASTWESRFDLLDELIVSRVGAARRPAPEILWAWRELERSDGAVRVSVLVDRLGRSRRHLLTGFREQVGLAPKTMARIIRFNRAVGLIKQEPRRSLVELAYECGYSDQAHLNRDFRAFVGASPGEFSRRVLPDGGVVIA